MKDLEKRLINIVDSESGETRLCYEVSGEVLLPKKDDVFVVDSDTTKMYKVVEIGYTFSTKTNIFGEIITLSVKKLELPTS